MKSKLEEHLQLFRDSQMDQIAQISAASPLYQVAVMSVSDTVSLITNLIRFMETTSRTYVRAKFSTKKAWYITTRLTKRIIFKIAKPRHGILETFKAGKPPHIDKLIFFSSLKCLDIMNEISRLKIENDPCVSNELVKFLSLNTEYDNIKQLEKDNNELKVEIATARRETKEAVETASTLGSKLDSLRSLVDGTNKRVK